MLKKLGYVALAVLVVFTLCVFGNKPVFYGFSEKYCLYLNDNSSMAVQVVADKPFYPFMAKVKGESCKVEKDDFSMQEFFESFDAELVFIEEIDGITCYYGYSEEIKFSRLVNGNLVNLQVAVAENSVTVGTPIIFGSF